MNKDIVILRNRKGRPGIGRKLARHFDCNEVTAGFRPSIKVADNSAVLCFGVSREPVWAADAKSRGVTFINSAQSVTTSVDKIKCFEALDSESVPTLLWTTERQVAQDMVDEGQEVVVRSTATGRQGAGIGMVGNDFEDGDHTGVVPEAPLYTFHYKKTHEFRVFVVNGKAVCTVQKKRMGSKKLALRSLERADELIRSHKSGWVFAHNDLICDKLSGSREYIESIGVQAANAVGLGFAGIDILAKFHENGVLLSAVVCETNSSPGLTGAKTFKAITDAIQQEYLD